MGKMLFSRSGDPASDQVCYTDSELEYDDYDIAHQPIAHRRTSNPTTAKR